MSGKPNCSREALERLALIGLANGARREGLRYVEWDISANCRNPVRVNRYSRASEMARTIREDRYYVPATRVNPGYWANKPARIGMEVTLLTKCRRCPECLRERAAIWRYRALAECQLAPRTWFGTLTLRMEEHYRLDALARADVRNWHELTETARYALRMRQVGTELTKWLKRVRKNSGVPLRYLAVTEIHTGEKRSRISRDVEWQQHAVTGYPHIHLLMHELPGEEPLLKKYLAGRWNEASSSWETPPSWTLGFTKFKLLDHDHAEKGAYYLCKYLSKAMDARVRASIDYGNVSEPYNRRGSDIGQIEA